MDTSEKKLLGKKLRQARKELGLTGEKLAELCHIDATYFRQIESGTKIPSLPVFVSLCRELKVSPAYLLSDLLPEPEIREMDAMWELWQKASPRQFRLISAMLRTALDHIPD